VTSIAVLGTGGVGQAVAARLAGLGHDVRVGSRTAGGAAPGGGTLTFADAAAHGEVVVNATAGLASVAALEAAGAENLDGKVLVDLANPLDFSAGFPPAVLADAGDSLAERIQATFPGARVVKALNTMHADLFVRPRQLPEPHSTFVAGNDAEAKATVRGLLHGFGWADDEIIDLGDLSAARGLELYLPLWLRIMGAVGGPTFNIRVVVGAPGVAADS
jgi:predicted dinucleotide-binding enzyme